MSEHDVFLVEMNHQGEFVLDNEGSIVEYIGQVDFFEVRRNYKYEVLLMDLKDFKYPQWDLLYHKRDPDSYSGLALIMSASDWIEILQSQPPGEMIKLFLVKSKVHGPTIEKATSKHRTDTAGPSSNAELGLEGSIGPSTHAVLGPCSREHSSNAEMSHSPRIQILGFQPTVEDMVSPGEWARHLETVKDSIRYAPEKSVPSDDGEDYEDEDDDEENSSDAEGSDDDKGSPYREDLNGERNGTTPDCSVSDPHYEPKDDAAVSTSSEGLSGGSSVPWSDLERERQRSKAEAARRAREIVEEAEALKIARAEAERAEKARGKRIVDEPQETEARKKRRTSFQQPPNDQAIEDLEDGHSTDEDNSMLHNSTSLVSPIGSNDDGDIDSRPRFPHWRHVPIDREVPDFRLGLTFPNADSFRNALAEHSIANGYAIKWRTNSKYKLDVVCKNKCGWRIYVSRIPGEETLQVKTYVHTHHNCVRAVKTKQITSKWLVEHYIDKYREQKLKPSYIVKELANQRHFDVSRFTVMKASRMMDAIILGEREEQYAKLWDYGHAVLESNPYSTVKIEASNGVFQRFYMCLEACKTGFKRGCRPFVGLDGCHLKGAESGQILSAIGVDANNGLFPIAIAWVEGETAESWKWFLELLMRDIGTGRGRYGWVYMSDRQKGLINAVEAVCPGAEHRYCVRHIHENMKDKGWKGLAIRDRVFAASAAFHKHDHDEEMQKLRMINGEAYAYLNAIPKEQWARSYFPEWSKVDLVMNNLNESFNNSIAHARDKPIITALEIIRKKWMEKFQEKREKMGSWSGQLGPRILKKLGRANREAMFCQPIYAGQHNYEVLYQGLTYHVDLPNRKCSCCEFQLSGLPCCHALRCIKMEVRPVAEFVHRYLTKSAMGLAYEKIIFPVPSERFWARTGYDPLKPPEFKRQPGRPSKKSRQRKPHEKGPHHMRRQLRPRKCSQCRMRDHTKRTCPMFVHQEQNAAETLISVAAAPEAPNETASVAAEAPNDTPSVAANTRSKGVIAEETHVEASSSSPVRSFHLEEDNGDAVEISAGGVDGQGDEEGQGDDGQQAEGVHGEGDEQGEGDDEGQGDDGHQVEGVHGEGDEQAKGDDEARGDNGDHVADDQADETEEDGQANVVVPTQGSNTDLDAEALPSSGAHEEPAIAEPGEPQEKDENEKDIEVTASHVRKKLQLKGTSKAISMPPVRRSQRLRLAGNPLATGISSKKGPGYRIIKMKASDWPSKNSKSRIVQNKEKDSADGEGNRE